MGCRRDRGDKRQPYLYYCKKFDKKISQDEVYKLLKETSLSAACKDYDQHIKDLKGKRAASKLNEQSFDVMLAALEESQGKYEYRWKSQYKNVGLGQNKNVVFPT